MTESTMWMKAGGEQLRLPADAGRRQRRLTPVEEEILAAVGLEPPEARRRKSARYRHLLSSLRQADATPVG